VVTSEKTSTLTTNLKLSRVFKTWLPLMASWMLMSIELPFINAVVARLANQEINLAAYGGIIYPLSLIIEAPIINLLAASTALSRDWDSYKRLQKIMLWMGGVLTVIHALIAFTPLYDFIVNVILHSPAEVVEPGRIGLMFMLPWSFSIGYRRFQQGAMIRHGRSRMVGQTTMVRLLTVAAVLGTGYYLKTIPGATLAGMAQGLGVVAEAVYAGIMIKKLYPTIKSAPKVETPLTVRRFTKFYIPLALTSFIGLLWQPFISAAISRMPNPLESLAVWSVISGLFFMFRSPGMAFNEAVVALLGEKNAYKVLRKFGYLAALGTFVIVLAFVATPLSELWLSVISNLEPDMVLEAKVALGIGVPLAVLTMFISFFQGIIVNEEKTGAIAEAVVIFLAAMGIVLAVGIVTQAYRGVYVAATSFMLAHIAQVIWLLARSRKQRKVLREAEY
jgi:hypothetical protein